VTGTGLIAGLVLIELFLQLVLVTPLWHVLPVVPPVIFQSNNSIGTEHIASNTFVWPTENRVKVHINSDGLRDRELVDNPERDEVRIVLAGDSVVEALQVNNFDTMDSKAEVRLLQLGHDTEIVNLGASGHGPLDQLVRIERLGLILEPQIVIAITNATDFVSGELLTDAAGPGYVLNSESKLVRGDSYKQAFSIRYADRWQGRLSLLIRRNSSLVRATYSLRTKPLKSVLGLPSAIRDVEADICSSVLLGQMHDLWVSHSPPDRWDATEKFFGEFNSSVRSSKAKSIYALSNIPIPGAECDHENRLRPELLVAITTLLSSEEITFVDWENKLLNTDVFKATGSADLSVFQGWGTRVGTGHYNPQGHDAGAEILSELVFSELAERP
jgi:hypothetical protein